MSFFPLLTLERAKAFALVSLVIGPILAGGLILLQTVQDPGGVGRAPLGSDFLSFWGAARLALAELPEQVYDLPALTAAYQAGMALPHHFLPFHYPPPFLLVLAPFGLLPYPVALGLFLTVSVTALFLALRCSTSHPLVGLFLLSSPGVFMCLIQGQNSILISALLFAGVWCTLRGREGWGGTLLALAGLKPHLAVVAFLYLVGAKRWKALGMAGGVGLVLAFLTTAIWGTEVWTAFFHNLPFVRGILEDGRVGWVRFGSTYAGLRLMGLSSGGAWVGHLAVSLAALGLLLRIRSRDLQTVGVLVATLVVSPFQFSYDLAVLTPAVILWAVTRGALLSSPEKIVLALLWVWPLVTLPLTEATHVQALPLLLLSALAVLGYVSRLNEDKTITQTGCCGGSPAAASSPPAPARPPTA